MTQRRLPYFDFLLAELAKENPAIEKSFGRHVHWGYWDDPETAICDDEDYGRAAEKLTLELCQLTGIADGEEVLDVGCGFGGTIASLNERFSALELTGLNIDAAQLARARQQVQPLRGNAVRFCLGDACALPFRDESFDRLLAVECIFHFESRETFFREARRVLKPGGVMVLSDFVPSRLFLPLGRLGTSSWFEKYNVFGRSNIQYTIARYRRLAAGTGFTSGVERNVTRHILPTYRYLQRIAARDSAARPLISASASGHLIGMLRLLGVFALLNYYLLSFRKP